MSVIKSKEIKKIVEIYTELIFKRSCITIYLFALLDHVIDHVMVFCIMELMNNYDVSLSSLIIRYGILLISSSFTL